MAEQEVLKRITVNPEIFGGKPIIRGMRISVELILSLLAQGETIDSILADYPDLEPDDIRACLAQLASADIDLGFTSGKFVINYKLETGGQVAFIQNDTKKPNKANSADAKSRAAELATLGQSQTV